MPLTFLGDPNKVVCEGNYEVLSPSCFLNLHTSTCLCSQLSYSSPFSWQLWWVVRTKSERVLQFRKRFHVRQLPSRHVCTPHLFDFNRVFCNHNSRDELPVSYQVYKTPLLLQVDYPPCDFLNIDDKYVKFFDLSKQKLPLRTKK